MTTSKYPPTWMTWLFAGANIIAIGDLPYGYYQLLRLLVTGYSAYMAYLYFQRGSTGLGWTFTFIAVLYNPLFIITMSKGFHAVVNLAVAGTMVAELKIARQPGDRLSRPEPPEAQAETLPRPSPVWKGIKRFALVAGLVVAVIIGIGVFVKRPAEIQAMSYADTVAENNALPEYAPLPEPIPTDGSNAPYAAVENRGGAYDGSGMIDDYQPSRSDGDVFQGNQLEQSGVEDNALYSVP